MQPPKLEKRPKKHKFWNREIEDNYYYLEENWQGIVKNPKLLPRPIKNYIDKENKYADHFLKDTKKIQKAIERGDFIPHEEVMKRFSKRERDEIEQNPDI